MIALPLIDLHILSENLFSSSPSLCLHTNTVHLVQKLPTSEPVRSLLSPFTAQAAESEKRVEDTHHIVLAVRKLQATRRIQMAKKYNAAHLVYTFNIRNFVT